MDDKTYAILCENLTKTFGEGETAVHALRGINFRAQLGKLTLLVGPSGCGKTTLLSVITGLLDATAGHLNILNQDPAKASASQRLLFRRDNIGFVFQSYNLLPALTAAENAAIPLLAAGTPWEVALAKSEQVLTTLGLKKRLLARPAELSGGEQQRVAIARAIVHEPRLIVCDEPTSALDAQTGHSVMELLSKTVLSPERAIIVVTHDERIFPFAHTIAHMNDGVITRTDYAN